MRGGAQGGVHSLSNALLSPVLPLSGRWKAQLFFSGKISSSRPFPSMESASHAADLLIYCSHLLKHGGGKGGNLAAAVPPANTNHPLGADVKVHLAKMTLEQVGVWGERGERGEGGAPPTNTNHPLGADVKAQLAKMTLDPPPPGTGGSLPQGE